MKPIKLKWKSQLTGALNIKDILKKTMDKIIRLDIDFESPKHIRSEYQNGLIHGKTNEVVADVLRKVVF